ncbi:probable LRR receptor-like serine/threonine-protein kinase At1g05700 [Typha angustifolia]|uniref:probable LRR receptor-like serine/threonine-protein kinase At1g05700 n=1 Tax=Typha angustifolia TaxID=59011 RepID=UPI003C30E9A4
MSPQYLYSNIIYNNDPFPQTDLYNFSIVATDNSTLPPVINAVEVYRVLYTTVNSSDSGDVTAMTTIKDEYQVKRNWMGDPCVPKVYAWDGLNCSYSISSPPRITTLNLSNSGWTGGITTAFADLNALQYLDLSYNGLTGAIPDELSQLTSLKFLDLRGNQLNGSVPAALLAKSQDGSLILRIDPVGDNGNEFSPKKKSSIIIVVVPVVVIVLLLVIALVLFRKRIWQDHNGRASDNRDSPVQFENRQFTYKELQLITNNFGKLIGGGGFGKVYAGYLENGTQVAVKMRSQSSSQGVKQFLAEAQNLARVHHKNLVCLIGYCKDGDHWGLVYEYMCEGTLEDHLRGKAGIDRSLTWNQRLRIALESAQGLEYLHTGCTPPLIHRDVKTNNILLNANLEAKLADFGLSKASNSDTSSCISTAVVGTPGYLDPQCFVTFKSNEKSDVYSFGVVLLEVVTGKAPLFSGSEGGHIIDWVWQRLARGNIENVLDATMQGECNLNSIWKVTELALSCTAQDPSQRPTMSDVAVQLKECLFLELKTAGSDHSSKFNSVSVSTGPILR